MVKIWTLFRISFLTMLRYRLNFVFYTFSLVVPLIPALLLLLNGNTAVLGFASTTDYALYLLFASTLWGGVEVMWTFVFTMRNQMREGILDETLMMPISVPQLIFGWTFQGILTALAQSIPLLLATAALVFIRLSIWQLLLSLLVFLLTFFSAYCFAVILMSLMNIWKETDQLVSLIANIAPFICGLIVPLPYIPPTLAWLGYLFPFTWALDIFRGIVFHYPPLFSLEVDALVLLLMTSAYFFIGSRLLSVLSIRSRRQGGIVGY